jgi:crotonobetainyl-CoA:carnitine CoA-transferase CaiB-like acyl-CoA transferase
MERVADELWPRLLAEAWAALDVETGDLDRGGTPPARLEADTSPPRPVGLDELWVTGDPGRLPSHLAVEDTAIACVGAALLAAAALDAQRGGAAGTGRRTARLDRGHVAAAVRSEAYLRLNGERGGTGFAPLSRFWRTADGWVRTHATYPWHREALLRALGTSGDPESVAAVIAGLRARDVENLVVGAGGVAAAVRGEEGWRAEPPGQAVAATRLVEGAEIGDAPGRRRAAGTLPASGIRVLDLTRVIAGPVATRYLGALGADVLRLDSPHRPELPLHAYDGLPGKRSALLALGTPDGNARLHELLSGADVLVHGYRPHALDRFGLTPDMLAERHPGLVVVSLSAWGGSGPWGDRRGFDSIVQAACGIAVIESADGERPGAMPCQLLDHGTGYLCAAAALRALARQTAHGGTQFRELCLARTASWLLSQDRHAATAAAVTDDDEQAWLTTMDSAEGPVTTVAPPGQLDGNGFGWPGPLSRYGGDQAVWR